MAKENSKTSRSVFEALEVLRPGHDDLGDPDLAHPALAQAAQLLDGDPQLAERLSRIAHTDEQLASAFPDVAVPVGLEGRILERLAADETRTGETRFDDTEQPTVKRRFARRRLLWAGAGAIAASIAVALLLLPTADDPQPISRDYILNQAIALFNSEHAMSSTGVSEKAPPADHAASRDVRHIVTARWRKIDNFVGSPAVAYDLTSPRGEVATLYVVRRSVAALALVTLPSRKPDIATGGVSATCWQDGELLYVLVVEGGQDQYDAFVRQPGSIIAVYVPRVPAAVRIAQAA